MDARRSCCSFVYLALAVLISCSRKEKERTADANNPPSLDGRPLQSTASASVSAPSASTGSAAFALRAVDPVEARRAHVDGKADGDPVLSGASVQSLLDGHFGKASDRGPLELQSAALAAVGRRVVLVMDAGKPTSEARPLAFVADEGTNAIAWSKARPVAGIMAPVGPVAVAPAPLGRVALAAYDPPTRVVALRIWDDDGSPFADFQAFTVDACDALSLLYWPKHGWVVVAAYAGATRAQLIGESGSPRWGSGLDLGARSRPGAIAPASLAADTDDTFVLVQLVQPLAAEGTPFHVLAFRYDARGTPIWPAAVDLGELARPPGHLERATLGLTHPGVRVATLSSNKVIDVKPSGTFSSRDRAPR